MKSDGLDRWFSHCVPEMPQGRNAKSRSGCGNGAPLLCKLPVPTPHFEQSSSPGLFTQWASAVKERFIKPLNWIISKVPV